MKNITISLSEELAKWARILAAENETSVSAIMRELLQEKMEHERNYQSAMKSFMKATPKPIHNKSKYPTRQEVHER